MFFVLVFGAQMMISQLFSASPPVWLPLVSGCPAVGMRDVLGEGAGRAGSRKWPRLLQEETWVSMDAAGL